MTEDKQKELVKAKVEKLTEFAKELKLAFKAVLVGNESEIKATITFIDTEEYPKEDPIVDAEVVSTEEVKAE